MKKIQKKPAIKDVLLVSSQTEEKPAPDRTHFRAGEPSSLSVDELANWLAGPSTKTAIPQKQVPQTDLEWYDSIMGAYIPLNEIQEKEEDIHFEECHVGRDPKRPHKNHSLMSKWVGKVPHPEDNQAYAFIKPVAESEEYAEIPYMPQLMGLAQQKIKEVLQTELHRKDQIKSVIVVLCRYSIVTISKDGTVSKTTVDLHHRGKIRPILSKEEIDEHITKSAVEIDKHVENKLDSGSGYCLERILKIFIEAYPYRQATGGSFKPTPKKLANTKCTINPDNKGLNDPETNKPSEKCLQGALGVYFAYQDGHTEHLERIFRAKKLKPYLDVVKLDGIPMPTPICSRIFNKIEEMNPDISINVWK